MLNSGLVLLLHIRVCSKNRSSKPLGFISESVRTVVDITVTENDSHPTSEWSSGLSEYPHTTALFSQDVLQVVLQFNITA